MPEAITVPSLQITADVVEQRLYDLERRRKIADQAQPAEDCCVTYCKFLTADSVDISAFASNTTALSLSVPILNPGRMIITVQTSWTMQTAGDFWVQINPLIDAVNYETLKEFRDQVALSGDKASIDIIEPFDYGAGTTGFVAVAVNILNLSNQTVRLRSGSLMVELKGRHGSVACSPATIGQ